MNINSSFKRYEEGEGDNLEETIKTKLSNNIQTKFVRQHKLKRALTLVIMIITNFEILCFAMGIISMNMVPCKLTERKCRQFSKPDGEFDLEAFNEFWEPNKSFFFWVNHIAAVGLLLMIIPCIYFFYLKQ